MVSRSELNVDGQLLWQVRRLGGIVTTARRKFTTLDLSIDGARISTSKRTPLPVGASVLISVNGFESPARVRALLPDPEAKSRKLLLLQFDVPEADFLRHIDGLVDEHEGGNEFKSEYWKNVSEDEYGEAEHAKLERTS